MKKLLTIEIESDVLKLLQRRAKRNMMSVSELISDIIRRSTVFYRRMPRGMPKLEDKLIGIFSREKRGRRRGMKEKRGNRK